MNFALRSNVVELFLQSRSITYETQATTEIVSTADLAEMVAPSVVQLLCYGRQETVSTEPPPSPNRALEQSPLGRQFERVENHDIIGFDYKTLSSVTEIECQTACQADASCRATTYNKKERFCFLKNDAKLLVTNSDASAYVANELTADVLISSFVIAAGRDMAGGDYKRIRKSNFIGCYLECETDDQCRAFAFVRRKNECWLKNNVGKVTAKSGVDLGVR